MPDGHPTAGAGLDLLPVLEFAVFERDAGGAFHSICRAPEWMESFAPQSPAARPGDALTEIFPYLEAFLPDGEDLWRTGTAARLDSDIWTQTDLVGRERRLRATAICAEGRNLLLIEPAESLFAETQGFVQHAHDASLAYDKIAKLSRALAAANEQLDLRNREVERATQAKSEFTSVCFAAPGTTCST